MYRWCSSPVVCLCKLPTKRKDNDEEDEFILESFTGIFINPKQKGDFFAGKRRRRKKEDKKDIFDHTQREGGVSPSLPSLPRKDEENDDRRKKKKKKKRKTFKKCLFGTTTASKESERSKREEIGLAHLEKKIIHCRI